MTPDFLIVLITVPSEEVGESIARHLLENHLAACVNILSGVRSLFRWQGEIHLDKEALLVVKTRRELFADQLEPAVKAVHPYDVPEIIAFTIALGNQEYLDWIATETTLAK